jgi:hypothetical protein
MGTKVNILSSRFERFGTGSRTDLEHGRRGDLRIAQTLTNFADLSQDPLQIVTDSLHEAGIETYASIRMNPDYGTNWMGEWLPNSYNETFYFDHPELRIRKVDGTTTAKLSYGYEQVRSRKLMLVEELCQYPINGISFDYLRHPPFVGYEEPLTERFQQKYGDAAHQSEENDPRWLSVKAEPLTAFMREAKKLVGERSIAIRVDHRHYAEQGLDLQTWINEGLIDILIVAERGLGGYKMDLTPFVAMAKGKCKLIAGEEALCSGHDLTPQEDRALAQGKSVNVERRRLSQEEYLERAAEWLRQGEDGVHLFNDCQRFELYPVLSGFLAS